jgi:hypothetical protein
LAGQVVKVLRETREPGREDPRWVVQPRGRAPGQPASLSPGRSW